MQYVIGVCSTGSVAVVDTASLSEVVVSYICDIVIVCSSFVAVHCFEVAAVAVSICHNFTVGIGHSQHPAPTVVMVSGKKDAYSFKARQCYGAFFLGDVAEGIVRQRALAGAILDEDGAAATGAIGAVKICHIVLHDIAITLLCKSLVCIAVKNISEGGDLLAL